MVSLKGLILNKFTLIIHNKGWSVTAACAHWNIHYDTYNARCNNPKMFNQLECMCNGLWYKRELVLNSETMEME